MHSRRGADRLWTNGDQLLGLPEPGSRPRHCDHGKGKSSGLASKCKRRMYEKLQLAALPKQAALGVVAAVSLLKDAHRCKMVTGF